MRRTLIITGDINFMRVEDPAVPFAKVGEILKSADVLLSNLECCFYDPPGGAPSQEDWGGLYDKSIQREGFYAPTKMVKALVDAGVAAVGNANNTNYGEDAITSSLRVLDAAGIAHTGAGLNREESHRPAIMEHQGVRFGMIQRTCVYWPNNHEATLNRPGVAAMKVHTAYRARIDVGAANRPGVPPEVLTFADKGYQNEFVAQVRSLRAQCDVAVVSIHWGFDHQVYAYQRELAHTAIDNGADLVFGHGPHSPLGVEVYKGRPIYYGLGSFSFDIGHHGKKHGDWLSLMGRLVLEDKQIVEAGFSFIRHNAANETILTPVGSEEKEFMHLKKSSAALDAELKVRGDDVVFLGG